MGFILYVFYSELIVYLNNRGAGMRLFSYVFIFKLLIGNTEIKFYIGKNYFFNFLVGEINKSFHKKIKRTKLRTF